MRIAWNEPRWSYLPRINEEVRSWISSTRWKLLAFFVFVFLPASVYFFVWLFRVPDFHFYYFPIIFFLFFIVDILLIFFVYYLNPCRITVHKKGIRITGKELFSRFAFLDISSIDIVSLAPEKHILAWRGSKGEISRGISEQVDLSALIRFIEDNAKVQVNVITKPYQV